jgi:hypothetical protein
MAEVQRFAVAAGLRLRAAQTLGGRRVAIGRIGHTIDAGLVFVCHGG